jgi:hypothetical protein
MASKSSDPLESAKQLCRDASELRAAARDAVSDFFSSSLVNVGDQTTRPLQRFFGIVNRFGEQ